MSTSFRPSFPATLICLLVIIALASCKTSQKTVANKNGEEISSIRFLSEYDVPNALSFKNTTVGGLSGIDYDKANDKYYLISDDRSAINPARFYTARIHLGDSRIDSVEFLDVVTLQNKNGQAYPFRKQDPFHTPDPEAMRYNPVTQQLVWSSEGERAILPGTIVLEDPAVTAIHLDGRYIDTFALPANMHMHATENGPRQNGVFEGLSFADNYQHLFVSVEEPIYEDGPRAGTGDSTAWVRFIKFDMKTRQPLAEYAYQVDAVPHPPNPVGDYKINGIPDILYLGAGKFIVLERAYSSGRKPCTIRIFLADASQASDVSSVNSVRNNPAVLPIHKKLLFNMDDLGRYVDNVEGVTFGPLLANGHRSLVLVVDNNFSKDEAMQFFLFEVLP